MAGAVVALHRASNGMQVTGTFVEGDHYASCCTEVGLEFFYHFDHDDCQTVPRLVCRPFYHFVYHAWYLVVPSAG